MTLAAITLPELAPILTIFVGMLGGFYVLVKFILTQSEKTGEADRDERKAFVLAIADMAMSNREIADQTRKGNREAEKRNGHLGEQNIEIAKLVASQNSDIKEIRDTNKKIVDLLKKGKDQHVDTQVVDTQTVNNKE